MVAKGNFELIRQRSSLREVGNAYLPKNPKLDHGAVRILQQNTFIKPPSEWMRVGAI